MTGLDEAVGRKKGEPICIVDTCIGGLSVLKSLWNADLAGDALFIADYAVNPLGLKSDSEIGEVIDRWTGFAEQQSETLLIACNTLSIRYQQLAAKHPARPTLDRVVSMVDCVAAMAANEKERLAGRNVLVIGTEFTAGQLLYPDLLKTAVPDVQVDTVAATELERRIARFEPCSIDDESVLTDALRRALDRTDVAVLACTCFPMVRDKLESRFPAVEFLDPGSWAPEVAPGSAVPAGRNLRIKVTGDAVVANQVEAYAIRYLQEASISSC